jgi:hypothetical protein
VKLLSVLLWSLIPGLLITALLVPASAVAQCAEAADSCPVAVPRLLKFSGTLQDEAGKPRTGTVGVLFSIYNNATGGSPLWQETQNIQLDSTGHYGVLLGAATTDGVPLDLFESGDPRWLGVQVLLPGEQEQPRVLLVSVPYALRAADAQTLDGLPASAFVKLPAGSSPPNSSSAIATTTGSQTAVAAIAPVPTPAAETPVSTPGGTPNTIPKFSASPTIINSQITDSNGVVSLQNLANIFFADQFPDGVAGAIAACPAEGCTIYAGAETVNRNLGTIDPGDKVITIYLGPFTYNVNQITLRKGLKIIGMGASIPGTILQSVNGNNPVFVIPQVNTVPANNVLLSGLRIIGSAGNTSEDGFFIDASSLSVAGLWYSEFNDLTLYGFAGNAIHLRGPNSNFGAANQWLLFNNVIVFRTPGGGNGLRIEGANFQLHFTDCEVDGQGIGDGTNVYIGGLPGSIFAFPFDITFRGFVSQSAAVAIQLDGAESVTFEMSHHESLWGAYLISGNNGMYTRAITIDNSVFNPNVGVNNGAGYLLNVATTLAQGIYFMHNRLGGVLGVSAPDSVITATNLAQVVYQDNEYFGTLNVPPTSGITTQISADSTINIGGAHTIGISPSQAGAPVTTIQSTLGPGEMVTFAVLGGTVTFATGGNIGLPGATQDAVTGTITFIRNDLPGSQSQWWPVSQWAAGGVGTAQPGFSLVPVGPSDLSVNRGAPATYTLLLTPQGGFSGSVGFQCKPSSLSLQCQVSPDPAAVSGSLQQTISVVVGTGIPPDPPGAGSAALVRSLSRSGVG